MAFGKVKVDQIESTTQIVDVDDLLADAAIGVTVQGFDADTAKLDVVQTFTAAQTLTDPAFVGTIMVNGSYRSGVTAVPDLNIDCLEGNYFTKTIDGSSTFTVSNIPADGVYAFTLRLTYLSGTITWFSNVKWPGGSAPPLVPNYVNVLSFMTDDNGACWYGAAITNYNY